MKPRKSFIWPDYQEVFVFVELKISFLHEERSFWNDFITKTKNWYLCQSGDLLHLYSIYVEFFNFQNLIL